MDRITTSPAIDPTTWVDRHGDYLLRFASARVKNRAVAEDLVQETLLAALVARHRFRGQASERSWLTAILKRKLIDWLRQSVERRVQEEPLKDWHEDGLFNRWGKWKIKPGYWSTNDPEHEIAGREFRAALAACLQNLPARQRQAVVLKHMDEESWEAVCQTVGTTPTNLWVMLHRARLRLWRCLTINWFGDERTDS
jgi:RNA polymerase sigma-70 factor (TIGR02943 family)